MKKIIICLLLLSAFCFVAVACMRIAHNTVIMQQEESGDEKAQPKIINK
jgi:hypothetical protein